MTLCEAVQIGYLVRRRGKSTWRGHSTIDGMGTYYLVDAAADHWMDVRTLLDEGCLELSDLLADDWEGRE
jgi:hypothetical protein